MNIEELEARRLLSATFTFAQTGTAVSITGSDSTDPTQADEIQLTQVGSGASAKITATDIRTGSSFTSTAGVQTVVVDLRSGNDYLRERTVDGKTPVIIPTTIFGGLGNDTIYGGDVNDALSGGDGDDKLSGRGGSDVLDGGTGLDTADYSYETRPVAVSFDSVGNDGVTNVGNGHDELDDVVNCEAVLGGTGNDTLIGGPGADVLNGGAGNDVIAGRGGNDSITGDIGADTIFGENGNDFLFAKDGTVDAISDGTGTDSASVDSKAAGAKVSDVPTAVAPPAIAKALAITANSLALKSAAVTNEDGIVDPSELDTTFGVNADGKSIIDVGGTSISVSKVLTQMVTVNEGDTEEKVLVVGSIIQNGGDSDFFVARLNADGSLDTTFGNNGVATADFKNDSFDVSNDVAQSAAIDSDGNIVLVGGAKQSGEGGSASVYAIARFTSDGQLDTTFGDDNSAQTARTGTTTARFDVGGLDTGTDIAVQKFQGGDEYVIAGVAIGARLADIGILRLNHDGTEDTGFTRERLQSNATRYFQMIVQDSSNNLWVASAQTNVGIQGTLITGFSSNGTLLAETLLTGNPGVQIVPSGLSIVGNKLIIVGSSPSGSSSNGVVQSVDILATLNPQTQKTTFSLANGQTVIVNGPDGKSLGFQDVTIDDEGRALAVGTLNLGGEDEDFAVYRFNTADLSADTTFNNGQAFQETDFNNGSTDEGYAVALQSDGKIIVAGTTIGGVQSFASLGGPQSGASIAVARYDGGDATPIAEIILTDPQTDAFPLVYINPDTDTTDPLPDYLAAGFQILTAGTLTINGTAFNDSITITRTVDQAGNPIFLVDNDDEFTSYDPAYVTNIIVNGNGGFDNVTVNDALGVGLHINGGENRIKFFADSQPDSDGNSRAITSTTSPSHGTAVISNNGTPTDKTDDILTYTPTTNYIGTDAITYTVTLGEGGTATQNVTFTFTPANVAPTAGNDALSAIDENAGPRTILASTLFANDSAGPANESTQALKIISVDNPVGGTVSIVNGNVVFSPTKNYAGPASFTYTVTDNGTTNGVDDPLTATATVTFTINPVATSGKLPGTPYGITGAEKAFDGNPATYVASPSYDADADDLGVGYDLGSPKIITEIRFLPRKGYGSRMLTGMFQASNDPNFVTGVVTLYTITSVPSDKVYSDVTINNPNGYRYIRYFAANHTESNVAEIEYYGIAAPLDVTPPTKPGKPVATAIAFTSIKLSWTASTDASGVSRYDIFRNGVKVGSSTTNSFADINLKPGTTFTYTVQAFDFNGNQSPMSDSLIASTLKDTTAPTKPGLPKKVSVTQTTVALTWAASTDNVAIANYEILVNGVVVGTSPKNNFTVIGLAKNTTYKFSVIAFDTSGNLSSESSSLSVKTLA